MADSIHRDAGTGFRSRGAANKLPISLVVGAVLVGALSASGCRSNVANDAAAGAAAEPAAATKTVANECRNGRSLYVAPGGLAENDGSVERPLDLATAISAKSPAQPCDTIWLRQGQYQGPFVSVVKGREGSPIVLRQYPGERATLLGPATPDPALMVTGEWTWFWGFEVTNLDTNRSSKEGSLWPSDLRRGTGLVSRARHVKFINLVVHDLARGFEVGVESIGTEIYGSLVYNNGWEGPDGSAKGNGIETQNTSGERRIADNVIFNQYSHGISAYTDNVNNVVLEGNILFNNGSLSRQGVGESRNVLIGGGQVSKNPALRHNVTYLGQTNVGYGSGCDKATITSNYFAAPLVLVQCKPEMTSNEFYDLDNAGFANLPKDYPDNRYFPGRPTGTAVRVRPNQLEKGRANIAVFNWVRQPQITLDLKTSGLVSGDRYEIRDAQNYFGKPIAVGTYDGKPVTITVADMTIAAPVGNVPAAAKHTAPDFLVFVVIKQASPGTLPSGTTS